MSSELLVILVVAIIVFPPKKLPELARVLHHCWRTITALKQQTTFFLQDELKKQHLIDNEQKAAKADKIYQNEVEF